MISYSKIGRCVKHKFLIEELWGYSSVGRALRSHRRGQGFESPYLHQKYFGSGIEKFK
jgi:hypothetical protein